MVARDLPHERPLLSVVDDLYAQIDRLKEERARIAAVLKNYVDRPLSVANVMALNDLSAHLNPEGFIRDVDPRD